MEKKRGVWLVLVVFMILSAASAMAAGSSTSQDIIVGVLVVAILIIIIVVLLTLILKKKAQKSSLLTEHHEIISLLEPAPQALKADAKAEPITPAEQPKSTGSGGFLAKARSLQQGGQTSPEGQKEDQYKVGGFKKEEVDKILSVPENTQGPMKTCKGCGFELAADEKVCPVCGRKQ